MLYLYFNKLYNNQTSDNDRPIYAIVDIMASSQVGHVTNDFVFIPISINPITTKLKKGQQHAMTSLCRLSGVKVTPCRGP